jgi:cadmium resistance protein CadD (predicted permease)
LGTIELIVIAGVAFLGSTVFQNKTPLGFIGLVPIVMGVFILS